MKSIIDDYKTCWRGIRVVGGVVLLTVILMAGPIAITVGVHYLLDLGIPQKYEPLLAVPVALVWLLIMSPVIIRAYDKLTDWIESDWRD